MASSQAILDDLDKYYKDEEYPERCEIWKNAPNCNNRYNKKMLITSEMFEKIHSICGNPVKKVCNNEQMLKVKGFNCVNNLECNQGEFDINDIINIKKNNNQIILDDIIKKFNEIETLVKDEFDESIIKIIYDAINYISDKTRQIIDDKTSKSNLINSAIQYINHVEKIQMVVKDFLLIKEYLENIEKNLDDDNIDIDLFIKYKNIAFEIIKKYNSPRSYINEKVNEMRKKIEQIEKILKDDITYNLIEKEYNIILLRSFSLNEKIVQLNYILFNIMYSQLDKIEKLSVLKKFKKLKNKIIKNILELLKNETESKYVLYRNYLSKKFITQNELLKLMNIIDTGNIKKNSKVHKYDNICKKWKRKPHCDPTNKIYLTNQEYLSFSDMCGPLEYPIVINESLAGQQCTNKSKRISEIKNIKENKDCRDILNNTKIHPDYKDLIQTINVLCNTYKSDCSAEELNKIRKLLKINLELFKTRYFHNYKHDSDRDIYINLNIDVNNKIYSLYTIWNIFQKSNNKYEKKMFKQYFRIFKTIYYNKQDSSKNSKSSKSDLYIRNQGEDLGGITNDLFQSICNDLFTISIFIKPEDSDRYFLNPYFDAYEAFKLDKDYKFDYSSFYLFIGQLIGFLILNEYKIKYKLSYNILAHTIYSKESINKDKKNNIITYALLDFQETFNTTFIELLRVNEKILKENPNKKLDFEEKLYYKPSYSDFINGSISGKQDIDIEEANYNVFLYDYSNYRLFKDPLNIKGKIPNFVYKECFYKMIEGLQNIRNIFSRTDVNIFALDDILYYKLDENDMKLLHKIFNERMKKNIEDMESDMRTTDNLANKASLERKISVLTIISDYINNIFDIDKYYKFPINYILNDDNFPDKTNHDEIKEKLRSASSSKKNKVKKEMYLDFVYNFLIYMSSKANIDENDDSKIYLFYVSDIKGPLRFSSHTCFSTIDVYIDFDNIPSFNDFYEKLIYYVYYSKIQQTIDNI